MTYAPSKVSREAGTSQPARRSVKRRLSMSHFLIGLVVVLAFVLNFLPINWVVENLALNGTETLNVFTDLARPAQSCLFLCDAGVIDYSYSNNGNDFSDALELQSDEVFTFNNIRIAAVRVAFPDLILL